MGVFVRRRVAAGLCAVALMAALVAFPVRARAAAAAAVLPAVAGAAAVTLYLNACGIYPFDGEGQSFGEWGARELTNLWDTYVTEVYPQSEAAQVISDVKAFYANGGYVTMAANTWSRLREFAQWIVSGFSLTSGREDVELGDSHADELLSVFSTFPPTVEQIQDMDYLIYHYYQASEKYVYAVASVNSRILCLMVCTSSSSTMYLFSDSAQSRYATYNSMFSSVYDVRFNDGYSTHDVVRGLYYRESSGFGGSVTVMSPYQRFSSLSAALDYAASVFEGGFSVVRADTANISIPAALPEGAELGGLAVPGATSAEALERIIEQGVMERQQPVVRPVEVEVGEGTVLDTETGAVTIAGGEVAVITPDSVPLSFSDYAIPSLSTVWPFSIPWDIARIYQAFDADPVSPTEFHLSFDFPILSNEPVEIDIALPENAQAAFDRVAQVVRAFTLIIACIAYTVWIGRFIRW